MDGNDVATIGSEAIWVFLKTSLPILLIALFVGLTISLIQALTQIQESTIAFVPKLVSVLLSLIFLFSYIGNNLISFSNLLYEKISGI
jgi:flagellar biosynthetic protein FliQ